MIKALVVTKCGCREILKVLMSMSYFHVLSYNSFCLVSTEIWKAIYEKKNMDLSSKFIDLKFLFSWILGIFLKKSVTLENFIANFITNEKVHALRLIINLCLSMFSRIKLCILQGWFIDVEFSQSF